jgi:hypothetical protein
VCHYHLLPASLPSTDIINILKPYPTSNILFNFLALSTLNILPVSYFLYCFKCLFPYVLQLSYFHFIAFKVSYKQPPFSGLFPIKFELKSHYSLPSFPFPKFFIYFVSFLCHLSSPAPTLLFLKLASYRLRLLKIPPSLFSHSHPKNLHLLLCLK